MGHSVRQWFAVVALGGLCAVAQAVSADATPSSSAWQAQTPTPGVPPERTTPDPPVRRGPEPPVTAPRTGDPVVQERSERSAVKEAGTGDEAQLINDAIVVLNELTSTPDNAIPRSILQRAEGIIVIPSLLKGGFIVGAKHGKGVFSVRDSGTGDGCGRVAGAGAGEASASKKPIKAAPAMISGKGAARKKMATKAAAAMATS